MRTRVKVCGMTTPGEVRAAVFAGADMIGVAGQIGVDDAVARALIAAAPPGVTPFLLTGETTLEGVVAHVEATGAAVVQLVRPVDPRLHDALRAARPGLKIVQVVQGEGEAAVEEARAYAATADALLLDPGRTGDADDVLGGGAAAADWKLSRHIVTLVDKPVFLAGALNEFNVGEAIATVKPFAVDLGLGLRSMGKLDQRKLSGVFAAVRIAS